MPNYWFLKKKKKISVKCDKNMIHMSKNELVYFLHEQNFNQSKTYILKNWLIF